MSLKAALAGLHQGGGKAVVQWDDPDRPRPAALLRGAGPRDRRARRPLPRGRGRGRDDRRHGRARARHALGDRRRRVQAGGSGDPSPVTAFGVVCAMRAAVQELDGEPTARGRRVRRQASGTSARRSSACWSTRVRSCRSAMCSPIASTPSSPRHGVAVHAPDARARRRLRRARAVRARRVLDDASIPRLRCRAIVGAANNQLGSDRAAERLAARDVLFVPDFVANAGGIINIAEEFVGYDRARALERAAGIEQTTTRVLRAAAERGVTPQRAAEDLARDRIAAGGRAPPLGTRRSRRVDQRRPAHPAAPDHPVSEPASRVLPLTPRTTPVGECDAASACCRCGRASSGRAGARR